MRQLFVDNYNSIFHVFFGIIANRFFIIVPLFLLYQSLEALYFYYNEKKDENLVIDVAEFFIGYFVGLIIIISNKYFKIL